MTALQQALKDDEVRSKVRVAALSIETKLHREAERPRHFMNEMTSGISSVESASWFLQHLSKLDRAEYLLHQLDARCDPSAVWMQTAVIEA